MAIPFLNHINLDDNQLQNAKLHVTSSAPAAEEGQIYFHSTNDVVNIHDGGGWETLAYQSWVTANFNNYSLPLAADGTRGGIQIGYTENGKNYPVELSSEKAFVNVPWTDTVYTHPSHTARTIDLDATGALVISTIDFTSDASGHVTSASATTRTLTLANLGYTGDTNANNYVHPDHSGHVTSTGDGATVLTVAAITGQTALTAGLASTDEFVISDNGVIKRMDVSVLQSYMQSNLAFTTNTNTTYDLNVQAGEANTSVIRLAGSDATNDDVTISGTSTTVKVTESGNTITLDLQDDVTIANDLTVTGDLTVSGSTTTVNTETINLADNIITLNSNYSGSSPTENGGIEVERGTLNNAVLRWNESTDRWQFTNDGGTTYYNIPISTEYNNYTHPTHTARTIDLDATGASVISTIDFTSNTLGHITSASATTRTLTLGDLGYTGDTGADNYGSWTIQDGDTTTHTITSGDTLQIASGGGITSNFTADDVLTISHNDTSSQASVNNSGRTYIQDITLDTYGHITGITSATETVTNTDTQLTTKTALIDVSAMGSNTVATINHGLGSDYLVVQLYDVVTGEVVFADIEYTSDGSTLSNNHARIEFASTPTNDIRVVIIDASTGVGSITPTYS